MRRHQHRIDPLVEHWRSDRLFCALFQRQAGKYDDFEGAEEEKAKCKEVNIMENAVDAAKDEALQKDAETE